MRLVKDARLLLPLTEVMKIARVTSPLFDESSPRPRLRHGRRLALLFHSNQTRKLCTVFFALSLALLTRLPPLLISQSVLLPGNRLRSTPLTYAAYLFSVSQPKALRSRARGYLSEFHQASCPEESHSYLCSPFSETELLAAASNLSPLLLLAHTKLPIPC